MNCKNCESKMDKIAFNGVIETCWCPNCGTLLGTNTYLNDNDLLKYFWFFPKSIEKTKVLVAELIKAKDKADSAIQRINHIDKDSYDKIAEWGFDDDKRN